MAETRRVLITGVSRFWGAQLARRLEMHPSIERIVAIDTQAPQIELQRTDYVRADIRHSLIGKLLTALDIDTVVHAGLIVDPRRASPRMVHETNVIGTMNLIAACSSPTSPVRKLIVKSSTAIYGAEPDDPSIWSEDMPRKAPPRDTFTRDLDEIEAYVHDFSVRRPDATTTLLRFANVLGPSHVTPFARLFDLSVVPTVMGFDPRLQFLQEKDAVTVLEHAVLHDHEGTYNVAGSGVVVLSQAISMLGKVNLPLLPFVGAELTMSIVNRMVPLGFAPHLTRLLQYGRVVDTSAVQARFGLALEHTTPETLLAHARQRRVRDIVKSQQLYTYETELEDFLRSQRAAHGNGRPASEVALETPSAVEAPAALETPRAARSANGARPRRRTPRTGGGNGARRPRATRRES
ncbi:MAG: NAD-dependent epimerase/dehydratase family protein [Candidatus Dormibacteria bacterium]